MRYQRWLLTLLVSVLCLTADEIEAERSGWNVDPETQYHIQTDDGPERYFRFQTLNGQYRKEKRLEDGTVIGTEGWLDPLGYLRIKDYIADAKGFRILKSKMIYVGKDRPIQDAVAISKKVPATGGVLARPVRPPNPFRQPELKDVSSNSIEASGGVTPIIISSSASLYAAPVSSSTPVPVPAQPSIRFRQDYIAPTTMRPRPFSLTTPVGLALVDALDDDDDDDDDGGGGLGDNFLKPLAKQAYRKQPALLVEPPFLQTALDQDQNHLASGSSNNELGPATVRIVPTTFRGYTRWNKTGEPASRSRSRSRSSSGSISRSGSIARSNRYRFRRPISARYRTAAASSAATAPGSNYKEYEFPGYDGSHEAGPGGFQYYLKKQYHEEERTRGGGADPGDKTVGSFGYVDPFGIRRVVYYKADGREGFVHRKNNRYVGHNAKPYDPVPVAAEHALN